MCDVGGVRCVVKWLRYEVITKYNRMSKQQLTPKKYIVTKARGLAFGECFINDNWQKQGMATILVSRLMPSNKIIAGMYNVDIFCLGLKKTLYKFGLDSLEMEELKAEMAQRTGSFSNIAVNDLHNLIYGSIDFAEELGFEPHENFRITEYILDPDYIDEGIDYLEFGKDGKPFYIAGPHDNVNKIVHTLQKNVGDGNFDIMCPSQL